MNKRISSEMENDDGDDDKFNVCYVIVTHGIFVDEMAHIFDYLNKYTFGHRDLIPENY